MGIRIYVNPPVVDAQGHWRAKAGDYCTGGYINIFPSKSDGSPGSTWVLTIGRATDWTAAEADGALSPLIPTGYTEQFNTPQSLIADLRTKTLGNLTTLQQTALRAWLDNHEVPTTNFTGATTLATVFRRVIGRLLSEDEHFAGELNF